MWAAAVLALAPFEAQATTIAFSFETVDTTFSVSGDLTISDTLDSAGGYDVTGISGTVSGPHGGAITFVSNPNQPAAYDDGSWAYDNIVFPSGQWVDNSGLLFAAAGYDYDLYSEGLVYYLSSYNPAGNYKPGEVVGRPAVVTIERTRCAGAAARLLS